MGTWLDRIMGAESLEDLCGALNEMEETFGEEESATGVPSCVLAGITEKELCYLPTFGGEEPSDTQGIWSWDEDNFLRCDDTWQIEPRA